MCKALLIVDVQNDYFAGGALALPDMAAAAENCRRLLQQFRTLRAPVIHIQHWATSEADALQPLTAGSDIHAAVRPTASEPVIVKTSPNAFSNPWLLTMLSCTGVTDLVVCGAMTQTCIDSTARAAFDLGFAVTVVSDGCAARDLPRDGGRLPAAKVQAVILAALQSPFARLQSTAELIDQLRAHGAIAPSAPALPPGAAGDVTPPA